MCLGGASQARLRTRVQNNYPGTTGNTYSSTQRTRLRKDAILYPKFVSHPLLYCMECSRVAGGTLCPETQQRCGHHLHMLATTLRQPAAAAVLVSTTVAYT